MSTSSTKCFQKSLGKLTTRLEYKIKQHAGTRFPVKNGFPPSKKARLALHRNGLKICQVRINLVGVSLVSDEYTHEGIRSGQTCSGMGPFRRISWRGKIWAPYSRVRHSVRSRHRRGPQENVTTFAHWRWQKSIKGCLSWDAKNIYLQKLNAKWDKLLTNITLEVYQYEKFNFSDLQPIGWMSSLLDFRKLSHEI